MYDDHRSNRELLIITGVAASGDVLNRLHAERLDNDGVMAVISVCPVEEMAALTDPAADIIFYGTDDIPDPHDKHDTILSGDGPSDYYHADRFGHYPSQSPHDRRRRKDFQRQALGAARRAHRKC